MWRKSIKLSGALNDYRRIEEQRMLKDLAEALDVAFDAVLCVRGLITTRT
jgi:hypothetical protein